MKYKEKSRHKNLLYHCHNEIEMIINEIAFISSILSSLERGLFVPTFQLCLYFNPNNVQGQVILLLSLHWRHDEWRQIKQN